MNKYQHISCSLFLSLLPVTTLFAEPQHNDPAISAADRKEIMTTLAKQLRANYIFPDVAERVITAINKKEASGAYASSNTLPALADALSQDLRELGKDGHFRVGIDPDFHPRPADSADIPGPAELAESRQMMAKLAYGIQRVEQLPGNIGYMELRGFGPPSMVGAAYTSAITLLQGTDALIIDLRRNGGGEPASVAWFMSHFFAEGDVRHLNDLYYRVKNETQQFWTDPAVGLRYNKPVYVLTAPRTFSGGEECAYDFQTQKRATLVGETTGGGSNPGEDFALTHDLVVFIPTGRAINPITKTNWEHVGVKPDIAVAAENALQTAHAAALKRILKDVQDPEQREELEGIVARVEKGEIAKPMYKLPQH